MRKILLFLVLLASSSAVFSQEKPPGIEGTVSYITSQSVYVRFQSTEGIGQGDTLFTRIDGALVPALIVENLSSISAVCRPIGNSRMEVGDAITGILVMKQAEPEMKPPGAATEGEDEPGPEAEMPGDAGPVTGEENNSPEPRAEQIYGRIGVTSYTNISGQEGGNSQRMRYIFSMNAENIRSSRISAETYIAFSHRDEQWDLIRANVYEGLKFYNLAVNYEITDRTSLSLGRKFNRRISSLGAIDGLQVEQGLRDFALGAIVGSRPDMDDYSYDPSLFQAGAYVSHEKKTDKIFLLSSLAVVEQQNTGKTDRRFLYLQHSNRLLKQLYLFGSGEFDLYELKDGKEGSTFSMTNAYLSLRYDPFKKLRLSASYSARNNIIYYETYKNFLARLLELETLQGVRLGLNYRPFRYISLGVQAGQRSRPDDLKPSRNLYAWISHASVPGIDAMLTLTTTLLETSYIKGKVYGISIARDLLPARLFLSAGYRFTDYAMYSNEIEVLQHVGEISLSWRIMKDLVFSVSDEATFEKENRYHRLFLSLRKSFKKGS